MAIVTMPLMSARASGNMGSLNYCNRNGRNIVREVVERSDPATEAQQDVRGWFLDAITNWITILTTAQREAWNEYASHQVRTDRVGNRYQRTGYNTFVGLFVAASRAGCVPVLDPPSSSMDYYFASVYSEWVQALHKYRFRLDDWQSSARPDGWQVWYAGPYSYEGRKPLPSDWRFGVRFDTFGVFSTVVVEDDKWYWYKIFWDMDDGRHGPPTFLNLYTN